MRKIPAILILALTFSCIQPEALNSEADILSVTLPDGYMSREPEIFNDSVVIHLSDKVFLKFLAPEFQLTSGATICPKSGTVRSFYSPAQYVVTSENGQWTKRYTVNAVWGDIPDKTTEFNFETVKMNSTNQYHIFYEVDTYGEEKFSWASGNAGFLLTGTASSYTDYPLYQSTEGYKGACACLITRTTGSFGPMVGMPIAAGNLFLGSFNITSALSNPRKATHFGKEWRAVPKKFSGKFKYTPGPIFYEKDQSSPSGLKPVPGKTDRCDIYAVFFDTSGDIKYLDGDNVLSPDNPAIISVAALPKEIASETHTEWTDFDLEFIPREGKTIDEKKVKQGNYSLAIVMTSSADGGYFKGAPGSCLLVDNITIK